MDIIKNDDELDAAVLRMRNLRGAKTSTPESNQMKILAVLAEAYEEKRHLLSRLPKSKRLGSV